MLTQIGAKTCLKHTGAERAGNIIVSSGIKREDNLNIGAVERELFTSGYGTSGYGTSATCIEPFGASALCGKPDNEPASLRPPLVTLRGHR